MTNLLQGSKTVKPESTRVESVAEFSPSALEQDGIWAHAFDESNEIEIPKYLDNPIKTGLDYIHTDEFKLDLHSAVVIRNYDGNKTGLSVNEKKEANQLWKKYSIYGRIVR